MDTVDPATRSRMMAGVRQRDTAPEVRLRHAIHRLGLRYRTHVSALPGRPDIVFPRFDAAAFVHGCYWHGHECRLGSKPSTRSDFWEAKFAANRSRDAAALRSLRALGWRTLVVWECGLKRKTEPGAAAVLVRDWLHGSSVSGHILGAPDGPVIIPE